MSDRRRFFSAAIFVAEAAFIASENFEVGGQVAGFVRDRPMEAAVLETEIVYFSVINI